MAVDPREVISVARERNRLKERAATALPGKRRRGGKPCPIQPCAAVIPHRWVTCQYHWSFVPSGIRKQNRGASRDGDYRAVRYSVVRALVAIWWQLDEAAVPEPFELPGFGHERWVGCQCSWCAPLVAAALKVVGLSPEAWQALLGVRRESVKTQ